MRLWQLKVMLLLRRMPGRAQVPAGIPGFIKSERDIRMSMARRQGYRELINGQRLHRPAQLPYVSQACTDQLFCQSLKLNGEFLKLGISK